jgi:hypothetical protein
VINKIVLLVVLLLIIGCKKKQETVPNFCPCVNDTNNTYYYNVIEDSAAFYHLILGTWYLKQRNSTQIAPLGVQCLCDTQYTVIFLANKNLILNLPDYHNDTVMYSYPSDTGNLIFTGTGAFAIPGSSLQMGQIYYSSNYLALQTQFPPSNAIVLPPTYYLTRH